VGRRRIFGATLEYFAADDVVGSHSPVPWHGPFAGAGLEPAMSAIASHAPCPSANVICPAPPHVRHTAGALTPRTTAEAAELW
jgi:hypothetical protein